MHTEAILPRSLEWDEQCIGTSLRVKLAKRRIHKIIAINARAISTYLVGLLFILAGVNHFINSDFYANIMPPFIPRHLTIVYVSGVFEVIGGISVLVPPLRRVAGWDLVALLIAVFPVHVHMITHHAEYPLIPYSILVARIPLQFILIAWVA